MSDTRSKLLVALGLGCVAAVVWVAGSRGKSGPLVQAKATGVPSPPTVDAGAGGIVLPHGETPSSPPPLPTTLSTVAACSSGGWCPVPSPRIGDGGRPVTFLGVGGSSADDVWVCGLAQERLGDGAINSVVLHWDGTAFAQIPTGSTAPLWGVAALSPTDAWIVGGGEILHWDGRVLRSVPNPAGRNLMAVSAVSPTRAWAAAADMARLLQWDGAAWSMTFASDGPPLPAYTFNAVAARSASDVWAGGDGEALLHWDGHQWHPERLPIPGAHVKGLWLDRTGVEAWAVGHDGITLRRVAQAWAQVPSGITQDLFAVWGRDRDDVWAAGAARILHWNGRAWAPSDPGVDSLLHGVWGNARETWVVGSGSTILRRPLIP